MRLTILAAAALSAGLAHAQTDDHLLDFGWLNEEQRQQVETAHTALAEAEAQMCATMVDLFAEHATRVQEGTSGLSDEETAFFKRRCEAEAFADHVRQSIGLHDAIHREIHAGAHGD